jgi:hypothetical protein
MRPTDIAGPLTHAELTRLFDYDPETGVFTARVARHSVRIGAKAGCVAPDGYIQISVYGKKYKAHRLAWFYMYGCWPSEIDHINLDKIDNRFSNLREATNAQQNSNRPAQRNNACGKKGVHFAKHASKWRAQIMKDKRFIHIGYFDSIEAAHRAYAAAARIHFGEFARAE